MKVIRTIIRRVFGPAFCLTKQDNMSSETLPVQPDNINLDELVNCLGYSIHSTELLTVLKAIDCLPSDIMYWKIEDKNDIINITFCQPSTYEVKYGCETKGLIEVKDELVVEHVKFENIQQIETKAPHYNLPFSLKATDTKTDVRKKIAIKPYDKQMIYLPDSKEGSMDYFDCPNFHIEAYYNENNFLFELMFDQLMVQNRAEIEFKKGIEKQKKNILPEFGERVENCLNNIPKLNFDSNTDSELNNKIQEELISFVKNCSKYTKSKNPKAIINSVKKTVEKINQLNNDNEYRLETIEREIICEFIDEVVKQTGFHIPDGTDITEEWREW